MGSHLWLLVFLAGAIAFGFSIEEELVCKVQSCNGNFVLRSENIFTFQLTADFSFLEERSGFKSLKVTLGRVKFSER